MPLIDPHYILSGSISNIENKLDNSNTNSSNNSSTLKKSISNSIDYSQDENTIFRETDPNIYQFLQAIIQLIYQSRSNAYAFQSQERIDTTFDPFQIRNLEGGSFQSTNLNIDSLGLLKNEDINLELEEINEINRDLTLWCEHLNSSPLKLDIFSCREISELNKETGEFSKRYEHQLLERWLLKFTSKQIDSLSTLLNRQLTISDELNIISPHLLSTSSSDLLVGNNTTTTTTTTTNNVHRPSTPIPSPISTSNLVKSLYYTLPVMPLFQYLLNIDNNNNNNNSNDIGTTTTKIKYGTSRDCPPPINFQTDDYKDLVKINFPVQETSLGTLSLTLQFPNQALSSDIKSNAIVIYPSRSCSANLCCHPTSTLASSTSSVSQISSPPLSSLLKSSLHNSSGSIMTSTTTTTNSNNNISKNINVINNKISTSSPNIPIPSKLSLSSSGSSSGPTSSTSPIPIKSNNSSGGNSSLIHDKSSEDIHHYHHHNSLNSTSTISSLGGSNGIRHSTPPLGGTKYFSNNRSPPSSPYSYGYSSTPPSLSFSPIHNHLKSTSPKFTNIFNNNINSNSSPISPPSSPYRVGYRPLFSNEITTTTNASNIGVGGGLFGSSPTTASLSSSYGNINNNSFVNSNQNSNNNNNNNNNNNSSNNDRIAFGSFQESILSGQMSNTPNTVFIGYHCDLGVSGKDYIPPHKKIPFSALYYHVDHDTPYVADIELGSKGSYRVPPKGLIQLTIFNPCHTPMKTFLVNYDISDMPPETKTFIRQRIISSTSNVDDTSNQLLKYAILLRFMSPRKRKYYLYKNIRVVFPNRLPDEMEKLKILYEYPPDPRYYPINKSI
ncbi:hypothetical protein DLAC_00599 [Tieghemostelium lacteum]|uniref:Atos-like conserved domain-containing protein n=1 Tax=Tieghemostelium lacteum TaxID=361077 RepID=A0A152AA57_TIELA|nr:hypothetical protein DLAC_00599 [Tieghemostelium lacteum]|eukprot:KYR03106.1 hypothetical protein DLAC_00599 [Tieghemostelium lacteum]